MKLISVRAIKVFFDQQPAVLNDNDAIDLFINILRDFVSQGFNQLPVVSFPAYLPAVYFLPCMLRDGAAI